MRHGANSRTKEKVDRHRGVVDASPLIAESGRHREPRVFPRHTSQTRRRTIAASLRARLCQPGKFPALISINWRLSARPQRRATSAKTPEIERLMANSRCAINPIQARCRIGIRRFGAESANPWPIPEEK
ncbi:MAG: hypothetical protein ACTSXZ_08090 [Alphaproteobacteria bacterium]